MDPTLLIAAHGTASATGLATTRSLVDAVGAARPGLRVELCFLDVCDPRLPDALDSLSGDVVVVPLLLSAGYHVTTDIPQVVAGRDGVVVARHLGPDPLIVEAVADRLRAAAVEAATTVLAAVSSTRSSAQEEVETARSLLEAEVGRTVAVLPLTGDLVAAFAELAEPIAVAPYLLAEGTFYDALIGAVGTRGVVAPPIGVHPLLVRLVLDRYDEAVR